MIFYSNQNIHKGFTLIELLIVILIISIVYALGFSGFELNKSKVKALSPLNLKSTITNSKWFNQQLSLLCIDNCKTCLIKKGFSSTYQPYDNKVNLTNIKVYSIDDSDSLIRLEYERYNDKKICLQMDFYPNGSSTQLILENETGSYYLPAYFEDPKLFKSPEDAKEYWIQNAHLVSNSGDFY